MRILIVGSANYKMHTELEISARSVRQAVQGIPGVACDFQRIRDGYHLPVYWHKIEMVLDAMASAPHVLCIDADAVMLRAPTAAEMDELCGDFTLAITKDEGHANTGVMCWRSCPESIAALNRIISGCGAAEFSSTPWNEQGILNTFIDELDVHYLDRSTWNAFEHNVGPHSLIRHWANVPNRRNLMQQWQES